jgi:gamma-glutamyltranspeptidase/glutathione hydrolase
MDPQRALDAPRIRIANEQRVLIESGIDLSVLAGLQQLGHKAELYTGPVTGYFGGGQIILRDHEQGTLWGGSDPRKDGCALGY